MDGLVNSLSELSLVFYVSASMLVQAEARSCWNFVSHNPRLHMAAQTKNEIDIPKIELNSDDENVTVSMVIPDFSSKDLHLKITEQSLDVKGIQKSKKKADSKFFQRTIVFPSNVYSQKADAHFNNGILTVIVPISSESQKKCIASILEIH
ncbi:MAG: Hsp20/alpha crystallin family protein [Cyanobacteria bacterium TGS_CYA1]|nr:Hsp20/alpha crystallin family protein [Cyanobacteria bacterium TGS_CYA1]